MSRRTNYTLEQFLKEAIEVHGNKFNYERVKFTHLKDKIEIICNICKNTFWQMARLHLCGNGCNSCRKDDKEKFLDRAAKIHGNEYDYSYVDYKDRLTKIKIFHKKCGQIFEQTPQGHLSGKRCNHCFLQPRKTREQFITEAKSIHGDEYDYSKLVYVSAQTKGIFIHKECGTEFSQVVRSHLNGYGCSYCYGGPVLRTKEDFVKRARAIYENEFDYSKFVYINSQTKGVIKHLLCGQEFEQKPAAHLFGKKCAYCYCIFVSGEYTSTKSNVIFKFDSSWELERMKFFDNCPEIIKWQRCNDVIKYFDTSKGRIRNYHPDFELHYSDGSIVVEEIKGRIRDKEAEVYGKLFYASLYYSTTNKKYRVLRKFSDNSNFIEITYEDVWQKSV